MKFLASAFVAASLVNAQSLAGLWDASVRVGGKLDVPFRFEISGDGSKIEGSFFNGDVKFTSSSGNYTGSDLVLNWDYNAANLTAKVHDGKIEGAFIRYGRDGKFVYPFEAHRFKPSALTAEDVPLIAGLWVIPVKSDKGEQAWRLIVRQSGPEVTAAVLRIDGDTGALQGTYKDGKFVLSHFSGARPSVFELTPKADDTLDILQDGKTKLIGVRENEAKAKGLPEPADPSKHTSVKDPTKPFTFALPDLDGKLVTNEDLRFHGKVVLINILGSWCPNCHDEAPFLAALYKKYRLKGLEIVALAFEEGDQAKDPVRLRAFVKKYGIEYTVLLGGEPSEAPAKLVQVVNFNAWPTTFFVGRDGLVRGSHAGFPSVASGELYTQAKADFESKIEQLLRERATP